jgi:hypothetical protein
MLLSIVVSATAATSTGGCNEPSYTFNSAYRTNQALADESTNVGAAGDPTATQSQSLKDCLAKQKAKNSAMSTADMAKACEAQKDSADNPKDSQATSPKQ